MYKLKLRTIQTLMAAFVFTTAITVFAGPLYLLSKPLEADAEIGITGRILHCSVVCLKAAAMSYGAYQIGDIAGAAGMFLYQGSTSFVDVAANTGMDLSVRQWWKWRRVFNELAEIDGVQSATILTSKTWEIAGPMVVKQRNHGFIFFQSDSPSINSAEFKTAYGEAIAIDDANAAQLRLILEINGEEVEPAWDLSLAHALAGEHLPNDIQSAWRDAVNVYRTQLNLWNRYVSRTKLNLINIKATLRLTNGSEIAIGTLFNGGGVLQLLGIGPTLPWAKGRIPLKSRDYCRGLVEK